MGIPTATDQARDQIQSNTQAVENKEQIDKLTEIIDGLKKQQKVLTEERDHTIVKYEESEVMWTQKHTKLQSEYNKILDLSTGLKDDNKDLMI